MEPRTIAIANNKTQRRYTIESSATTLGQLKAEMAELGIDYVGMTFTEGISKTQLLTDDSLLPTQVMFKGQPTNNLVILLTNTNKQIASGASDVKYDRKALFATVKEFHLEQAVKDHFGKNFTQVSSAELNDFLSTASTEATDEELTNMEPTEAGKTGANPEESEETEFIQKPKKIDVEGSPIQKPASTLCKILTLTLTYMAENHFISVEDINTIMQEAKNLQDRLIKSQQLTDEDIDNIIAGF